MACLIISPLMFTTITILLLSSFPFSLSTFQITQHSTLLSPNRTFSLGFISPNLSSLYCYLAIYYTNLPSRTTIWVANRAAPSHTPTAALISGKLSVGGDSPVWHSDNSVPAASMRLLDSGNLLLLSPSGRTVWQSFLSSPSDTWLPGMPVTRLRPLLSWRSPSDPSPGPFSLRLRPPDFAEFELVFDGSVPYWSTGNWTGSRFTNVPEMTVPYIYEFRFEDPYGPDASFSYSVVDEVAEEAGLGSPALSRFVLDPSGQFIQYTWLPQEGSWSAFWSKPDGVCRVYGRCGRLGICTDTGDRTCECPAGLRPAEPMAWVSGDFSGGCSLGSINGPCSAAVDGDLFEEIGPVNLDGARSEMIAGVSRSSCEELCRSNCSCFGLLYDPTSRLCQNLYGDAYNMQNDTARPVLFLRVQASKIPHKSKSKRKKTVIISLICLALALLVLIALIVVFHYVRRKGKEKLDEEDESGTFSSIKVFSLKELCFATKDFSERVGQGSFGAVFRGELPDSTRVAVKRLERGGAAGGDREFRAEVRTIGSVHHVNLVRLRGFCSEGQNRLLVYDLMPLGPLSAHIRSAAVAAGGAPPLSWPARVRIAVGTARALAYLHEGCRDCIIHCDIKPENILLDSDYTPKVSDFGLAKLIGRDLSRVVTTMRGTLGYVAPEWIAGTAITAKADVYSYGMTLLEILGGRRNAEPAEGEGWVFYPAWAAGRIVEGDVAAAVDPKLSEVGGYDLGEAERMGKVAVWCIQEEEAARPTMATVIKMLEGTVAAPPPPPPRLLQALVAPGESFRRREAGDESDLSGSGRTGVDELDQVEPGSVG